MRNGTLYPYVRVPSSGIGAVTDARLTSMIVAASNIIDTFTNDHFEASAAATIRVHGTAELKLMLPKRVRAITSVSVVDYAGTVTAFDSTYWRIHTSFKSVSGTNIIQSPTGTDALELKKFLTVGDWIGNWPAPPSYIEIVGDFDWLATPEIVKWAAATLVWSWCRSDFPPGTEEVDSGSVSLRRGRTPGWSTGLREVDDALRSAGMVREQYGHVAVV